MVQNSADSVIKAHMFVNGYFGKNFQWKSFTSKKVTSTWANLSFNKDEFFYIYK